MLTVRFRRGGFFTQSPVDGVPRYYGTIDGQRRWLHEGDLVTGEDAERLLRSFPHDFEPVREKPKTKQRARGGRTSEPNLTLSTAPATVGAGVPAILIDTDEEEPA